MIIIDWWIKFWKWIIKSWYVVKQNEQVKFEYNSYIQKKIIIDWHALTSYINKNRRIDKLKLYHILLGKHRQILQAFHNR